MNYSTIHLPILTLTQRVENMKINLDGLPIEYGARLENDKINANLDHIIDELKTITREIVVDRINTLDRYHKDDADLFLGRNLDDYEWQELKDAMLGEDYLWEQFGEYANEWIKDNIIDKEEE